MYVLFVIDPLETLNLATETSLLLVEELARRGHQAAVATLPDLYLTDQGAGVRARSITLDLSRQPFYTLGDAREQRFGDFDLVLMRKDRRSMRTTSPRPLSWSAPPPRSR